MSVRQLADLLRQLQPETTDEDIRDILWLAPRIGPVRPRPSRAHGHDGESRSPPPAKPPSPARDVARGQSPDGSHRQPDHTLHLAGQGASVGRQAAVVRVPAAPALADRLGLGRALRPLKRRTPSRDRFQLDELATADNIADGGLWIPSMRAAPERWLELAVVVDGYESMSIWRQLTVEFREVLEQLGAFRDVRFWVLDRAGQDPSRLGVRRWRPGAPQRSAGELTDPAGRRAIIVISDCVGPLWRSGAAQRLLAEWGTHQPVAIIQPLPQRLWTYTHARPVPVTLHAGRPGVPNALLAVRGTAEPTHPAIGMVPVPVLELDPAWLVSWSRLVSTAAPAGVPALAVLCRREPNSPAGFGPLWSGQTPRRPPDARQILQRFRASASPEAFQLAAYLAAAAPINLPVIQIIQQEMFETPRQSQLAEVYLGGLLRRVDPDAETDPDAVHYEFVTDELRGLLLKQLGRSDMMRVLLVVSAFLDVHFGQARDFRALLAGQDITGDHLIGPDSPAFALIAERLLRLMGGRYIVPADRLATAMLPVTGARLAAGETLRIRDRAHPLVCPYCYHAFAEREIMFRCSGRTGTDGTACELRADEVLEQEMGESGTLLPPAFAPGKDTDQISCPFCRQPTRVQLCPRCHSQLPATFRSVEGRLIAFAGSTLAGKTAFMTVLIHELRHRAGERLNASAVGADDHTFERFARDYESPLYRNATLFPKTKTTGRKYIKPLVFRFVLGQRALLRRPRELLLSFADGAGEDLVSPDKVELMTRYLSAADGVVILIDPLQLPSIREAIGTTIDLPPLLPHDQVAAFDRITRLLLRGSDGALITKPVAVVLTKLDTLWDLFPQRSPLRPGDVDAQPGLDDAQTDAVQQEVIKILISWNAGEVVDIARENYTRAQFFAVSALGAPPTQDNLVSPKGITPYRITDPFLWLLRQFSLIGSRRD